MRRVPATPRPNSKRLLQSQGLVFGWDYAPGPDGQEREQYWPDNRYYSFTSAEIQLLERAARDVFDMCCEAAEHLTQRPHLMTERMAIPAYCLKQIVESWNREPAWGSVYGRFDVCFGGLDHPDERLRVPKFYEFNADTPTSLVEAAALQWLWLEQTGLGNDQWNGGCERLVAAWRRNLAEATAALGHRPAVVHFAIGWVEPTCEGGRAGMGEDAMNVTLLAETCRQAGYETKNLFMEQVALGRDGRFYDPDGQHIDVVFKLYPWEHMVRQEFGERCFADMERVGLRDPVTGDYVGGTVWIEAPYKMLWSNKAVFAVLWELFRDDPRSCWLLPTYLEAEAPRGMTGIARKPIFAREGAGIRLERDGEVLQDAAADEYGAEGYVVQELAVLPAFADEAGVAHYPVLGLWFVDGEPAGMGIREDTQPITSNESTFVPHSISDGPLKYKRQPVPTIDEIEAVLTVDAHGYVRDDKGVLSYINSVVG